MSECDTTYTDWQQRVYDEKGELNVKLTKLTEFMHSDAYSELNATDQGLLMVQHVAMRNYAESLGRRLETF